MTSSFMLLAAGAAVAAAIAGCEPAEESGKRSEAIVERRGKIERRVKESLPKTEEIALAQTVDPAVVKKAQTELKVLKEYLEDQPSGKIDMVTVNAIEAFQRRVGLADNGLLDAETLRRLDDAAKR